jgi:hypothetical protein
MLEATSYGLIALGVILVAAFCFVWVEEKAALRANRSASLADESAINLLRFARTAAVNRSQTEFAGREELLRFALSFQMTSPAQARPNGPDGNSLPHEQGPEGVSHG